MIKTNKIPTILGIIVLLVGTFAGVFFLNMNQVFRIGADTLSTPKNIRMANITDTSATISWSTDKETAAFIVWGAAANNIQKTENETVDNQKFFNHTIDITGLKPNTPYFFKINSDGTEYDNGNIPWQFTTGATLDVNQNSMPISGSVMTSSGQPSSRAIVYMTVGGYLMSTLTSSSGNFVFQLGSARSTDLQSYATVDPAATLLEVSAVGGPGETVSANIFPQSARPIPTMVFGQVYDFRSQPPNGDGQSPNANPNLPENSNTSSKFKVSTSSGTPAPTSVILESLTEGETVTSNQPQFFGKGPGGENITITVHSQDPITQTVQIPKTGSWSWSVPNTLEPGAHTITVSWIDATGITRQLTRDFVVQAGELPSFQASGSATPTGSPIPTTSGTATPKPTLTPKPTATETAQPVPVTGDLTPTLLLFMMGIAVSIFSFSVWKLAEK